MMKKKNLFKTYEWKWHKKHLNLFTIKRIYNVNEPYVQMIRFCVQVINEQIVNVDLYKCKIYNNYKNSFTKNHKITSKYNGKSSEIINYRLLSKILCINFFERLWLFKRITDVLKIWINFPFFMNETHKQATTKFLFCSIML